MQGFDIANPPFDRLTHQESEELRAGLDIGYFAPDEVIITQGSVADRRFAAVYGAKGRVVAAVTFNQAKWLEYYERLIQQKAAFPPEPPGYDRPAEWKPVPAEFPHPGAASHEATAQPTGHAVDEHQAAPPPPSRWRRVRRFRERVGARLGTRPSSAPPASPSS